MTLLLLLVFVCSSCDNAPVATPTNRQPAVPATVGQPAASTPVTPITPVTPVNVQETVAVTPTSIQVVAAQESSPTVEHPTYAPPTGTIVDAATTLSQPTIEEKVSSPTPVEATATGASLTALQALDALKAKAIAWKPDARLAMLTNVRPGQEDKVLGGALGDPNVNEPTPGGRGKNWTLIAFSPGGAAAAFGMDGGQTDLVKAGAVTSDMLNAFKSTRLGGGANLAGLELSKLGAGSLTDSDKAMARSTGDKTGIALIAPVGLGLGPLPAPKSGGRSPALAYEIYSTDPAKQTFIFLDAQSGEIVLDSSAP